MHNRLLVGARKVIGPLASSHVFQLTRGFRAQRPKVPAFRVSSYAHTDSTPEQSFPDRDILLSSQARYFLAFSRWAVNVADNSSQDMVPHKTLTDVRMGLLWQAQH